VDIQQRVEGELLPLHLLKERISQELSQRVWHKGVAQYLQLLVAEATIEGIVLNGADSPLLQ
jgi:peptidyl-prolyl cis-trans isomerase C